MKRKASFLVFVIGISFLFACTHSKLTNILKSDGHQKGTIFLTEKSEQDAASQTAKTGLTTTESHSDSEEIIDPAEIQGIIFLDETEQVKEISGMPVNPFSSVQRGKASYYADSFAGKRTASGEIYDPQKLTAAHRTLPFGTRVRVKNLYNDREVIVRINDRGPFIKSRIIDLSRAAAEKLGMINYGVAEVLIEVIK